MSGPGSIRLLLSILCFFTYACVLADVNPTACQSPNPNDWPKVARPYFLVIADTSGSMTACTSPPTEYPATCDVRSTPNSCGLTPTRYNDLKCALDKTISAFSGQARFGLSTFATYLSSCPDSMCVSSCGAAPGDCFLETYGCSINTVPGDTAGNGCGPINETDATTREGSILRVPIAKDFVADAQQEPSNAQSILAMADNYCGGDNELHAAGQTPLNGALRDAKRYFERGLTNPLTAVFHPTPLDIDDRACRSVNVILITDGDETCDTQESAVKAAYDLAINGVDVGNNNFPVKVHVVNFAGGTQENTDAIAAAGDTGGSLFATNEVQLSQALSSIISKTQGSEVCDNVDNNCNGCIDEGFQHFAHLEQACCKWENNTERELCLSKYQDSIVISPPNGDVSLLPCTSLAQQTNPSEWLCYNPGEVCDGVDNNGLFGTDENQLRCGDPLRCPKAEICNGMDDDCDGQIDEGGVCGTCTPSAEICDGCDNDCDGIIDNGDFPSVRCGLAEPANCGETRFCAPPQLASTPGACVSNAAYGSCNITSMVEICDGLDNDCNGVIDDQIAAIECIAAGTPDDLSYGGSSQCRKGLQYCGGDCTGFIGPTADVTDGIDNNCDGIVDNIPPSLINRIFRDGFEFLREVIAESEGLESH